MNDAWNGRPSDPIKGTTSPSTRPQRIRNADVEPHVKRGWSLVLDAARRLVASRRQSMEIDATGVELWARLRKSVTDAYGRPVDGKPTYSPFVADRVKELPPGAPTVDFLEEAPPALAEAFADEANVTKDMTDEERLEFEDLCRRYDHFGVKRVEWMLYHARSDVDGYWHYDLECYMRAPAAVLAVGRAKDDFLRKILALCPANFAMKALSILFGADAKIVDLGMLGGALLARIRAEDGTLEWAGLDLS